MERASPTRTGSGGSGLLISQMRDLMMRKLSYEPNGSRTSIIFSGVSGWCGGSQTSVGNMGSSTDRCTNGAAREGRST